MKHHTTSKSLSAIFLAASATSLCAIERPIPAEQPKEKVTELAGPKAVDQPLVMPEARVAQRPFLGVIGVPVDKEVSKQLGLADGIGLTLQHVAQNTPAAQAGLKENDIITQIGGVDIGSREQLRDAILKHKPNDKVEIKYISEGEAMTKQIVLGTADSKPQALGDLAPRLQLRGGGGVIPRGALPKEMLENLPPEHRQQLEQLLQGNLNRLDFRNLNNQDLDQLQKHFKGFDNEQRLELDFNNLMGNGANSKTRMKMMDPEGSVTLETEGNQKSIELHDTDGKLLYKGPFNTKEDKLKIPENLRKRADKLRMPKMRMFNHRQKRNDDLLNLDKDIEQLLKKELQQMELPEQFKEFMKEGKLQGPALPKNGLQAPKGFKLRMNQGNANGFQFPEGGQQMFEFKLNGKKGITKSSSNMIDPATGNFYSKSKHDDGHEIEIKDKAGKLLYSGPLNSSSDYEMVPEEFRPFLKKLDSFKPLQDGRLKLHLGPKAQP